MYRLAAPLFILLLTALAFAQTEIQPTEPPSPTPAPVVAPSDAEKPAEEPAPTEVPPSAEPSPAPAPAPTGEMTLPSPDAEPAEPVTGTPSPETAAEPAPAVEPAETATADDALEIIVIASASLNEKWGEQSKAEALKEAMRKAIRYVPKNMDVGLRVSGHRIPADEADRSCQDSELLIAPKAQGQSILLAELGGIQAQGVHSLLQTLSRSLADLNDYKGTKNILLITDGEEACVEQAPAAYLAAESLGKRGYRIHIRGINLPEEQHQGLAELAELTGGSFSSAMDTLRLQQELKTALQRAGGEEPTAPVSAGEEPAPAPEAAQEAMTPQAEETPPGSIPATPPPSGVKPEPKEPPFVGPAPLPFNPTEFMKSLLGEIKKIIPRPPKPAPPPPPPPTPTFSATSITIIVIESVLLALALVGIVLLALKQYRQ